MSQITTHVLDISSGKPAAGIKVVLEFSKTSGWELLGKGTTDADGRIKNLMPAGKKVMNGTYRLIFDTRLYFYAKDVKGFYPSVTIEFEITDGSHYHVPLLLSPFGYSTYRGS